MKINTIQAFFVALLLNFTIISCTPESSSNDTSQEETCDALASLNALPFTPVTTGEPINLAADYLEGANYYWTGPNGFDSHSQNPIVTSSANYNQRGTYYVSITRNGCPDRVDSVIVDVNFPQGTPSCALINNRATFGGPVTLATQNYYFMTWGADPVGNNYRVVANGTNGDMTMYMSQHWITNDFEDGIYYTTNSPSIDYNQYDKIYMSNVNGNTFWACQANQPVYVSHVGGKIRVSFCNVTFSGVSGVAQGYTTSVSAQLTQP